MSITERFYLEKEPCVIYLPEKPNGFSVMLLGDYNYFIENGTSLWTQHAGKSYFYMVLLNKATRSFPLIYTEDIGETINLFVWQNVYMMLF